MGEIWVVQSSGVFVPDGVTSTQTNPLWNGSVLLLGLGELLLRAERLVALYTSVISHQIHESMIGEALCRPPRDSRVAGGFVAEVKRSNTKDQHFYIPAS